MIIGLLGKKGVGKDTAGAVLARELNGTCLAFADPMKRFCMKALGLTERQLWGDWKEKPITKVQHKRLTPKWQKDLHDAVYAFNKQIESVEVLGVYHDLKYRSGLEAWLKSLATQKDVTTRLILQTFGTEFGRQSVRTDLWADIGLIAARKLLDGWAYDKTQGLAKRHGGSDAVIITDLRFRNEVLAVKRAGGKVVRVLRPQPEESKSKRKTAATHASETEQESIPNWWCDYRINNDKTLEWYESKVREVGAKLRGMLFFPDPRFR